MKHFILACQMSIDNIDFEQLSQGLHEQSNGNFAMIGLVHLQKVMLDYMFRKGGLAIIALAGCDANGYLYK
jgi:hypothetical protein